MKSFLFILFFTGSCCLVQAQALSYVYIQGDKKTPIYVKLDDEMMPRYGKNYCILPQLVPGPIHVTILFQQNIYPPQDFTIVVPENGSRHFLLTTSDTSFALYDLTQRFYLHAGNSETDDHVPLVSTLLTPNSSDPIHSPLTDTIPVPADTLKIQADSPASSDPRFLNMVLDRNPDSAGTVLTDLVNNDSGTINNELVVPNSDCPSAISDEDFGKIYRRMIDKSGDEDRLSYIEEQSDKCYSTWQVRTLASMLSMDAARFSLFKKFYSRITDQKEFPLLDDLLRDSAWKDAFSQLIHPNH